MTDQTPRTIESIVDTPGSDVFDVDTAWSHIGRAVLLTTGARNLVYSRESAYVAFEAGHGRTKCRVVVKLDPSDEYSVEFHRVDTRPTKKARQADGSRVQILNENFGRITILGRHLRIPLENLREIILDHFA